MKPSHCKEGQNSKISADVRKIVCAEQKLEK